MPTVFLRCPGRSPEGAGRSFRVENEVISTTHWTDTPAGYFQLLRVAADATHAANPDAIILDSGQLERRFSIIEARKQWLAGDPEGALATIQKARPMTSAAAHLTSTSQLPAYLSNAKVMKMPEFYDQLVAHQDPDRCPSAPLLRAASSIPADRRDGQGRRFRHADRSGSSVAGTWTDDRFSSMNHADEVDLADHHRDRRRRSVTVLQQYFDKPETMYGLIDGDGNSRQARFAVRKHAFNAEGHRSARAASRPVQAPMVIGSTGPAAGGGFWATGDELKPGKVPRHPTTVAVTSNQGGTTHLPVSSVTIRTSPQWFEPGTLSRSGAQSRRKGFARVKARCLSRHQPGTAVGWTKL